MSFLEFIFAVVCLFVGAFVIIGATVTICDTVEVVKENDYLRKELEKARKKKVKSEYKKNEIKKSEEK